MRAGVVTMSMTNPPLGSVDPDAMPHPVACRIFVEIRTVLFFE